MVGRDKMGIAQFRGLFRGKRVDNDEWVEGYLIQSTKLYGKSDPHTFIVNHEHPQSCFGSDIYIEVIPETVGYFTWLQDKNGVRVFEGDITRADNGHIGHVAFRNGSYVKVCSCHNNVNTFCGDNETIIGNIYDNPELLVEA